MRKPVACKIAAAAALSALLALSLRAATRVWSQTSGFWSTRPEDTPFTGRSFTDYDDVVFNDPENLALEGTISADVTVRGAVLPSTVTFNNAAALYFARPEDATSSIGSTQELGRVQFITKNGAAPVTVTAPVHCKNIVVNGGELTLDDMPEAVNSVSLESGTTLNFRYTGPLAQTPFASYSLESDSIFHRIGKARFTNASFPQAGSTGTVKPGARMLFDALEVDGLMRVSGGVRTEALESARIHRLNVWDKGIFQMSGASDMSRTNRIDEIDVMREGVVHLKEGCFSIGSLATNELVSAETGSGAAANGRLVVGGDPSDTNRTSFTYDAPPGIVYTQNEFIGNTVAVMPEVTIGGDPAVNSCLYVTNGADVRITGKLIAGGGDDTNRVRLLTIADNATVRIDGYLDLSDVGSTEGGCAGKGDARVMVSGNSVFSTAGIHYGKYDEVNQIRQVFVSDGAEFELGGNNAGEKIAKEMPKNSTPSVAQAVCTPQTRPFILDNGTLRFTADQIFDQALFLQEFATNTVDLAGHTVTNKSALLPYFKGEAHSAYMTDKESKSICRFIIMDSSPEQSGFLYLEPECYGVRNGNNEANSKTVPGYSPKTYGTQLYGGRLRVSTSQSSSVGFSLYGGILELPVGTDYESYVRNSYSELTNKYDKVLASVWHSEVGATIRCYVSSKDKLIRSTETNKWQMVCNVNVGGGMKIADFMRLTTFELIEEDTGKMLSGASFHAFATTSSSHYGIYMTYDDNEMDESAKHVTDVYWCGGAGEDRKWTDDLKDPPEWLDQDGEAVSYIDEVNVHFTNIVGRLKLTIERETNGDLIEYEDDAEIDHGDQVAYSNSVPVVAETLAFTNCEDVCVRAGGSLDSGTLVSTPFVSVADSVVDIDSYLVCGGNIEVLDNGVMDGGALLTATNLVRRSRWYVGKGATFHAGYHSSDVTFSTMSHAVTNFGTLVYDFNGRVEKITQPLSYPTDAYEEGDECYYEFVNGTLQFDGVDYLTRRDNTNVWISAGCVRQITGSANHQSAASATSTSPLGYKNGGMLQVDVPYRASKGSVLKNSASFMLNDVFTMVPGASISVVECDDPSYAGCVEINGSANGALAFDNNGADGATFETSPFRFYTAAGETNMVNVALTGKNANIEVEGGGTLCLGDAGSTVTGTLTVKSGARLVVAGPQSLGALDVVVENGGAIIFKDSGRPQNLCKTLTLRDGAIVGLGPSSSVIEPQNPVHILGIGQIFTEGRIVVVTSYDKSGYAAGSYGIEDASSIRTYTNARAFQGHNIELFGLLGDLIWDVEERNGFWFSTDSQTADVRDPLSRWHPAAGYNTFLGYTNDAPLVDFRNWQSNAVTFLSQAEIVVSNYVDGTAAPLLPSAITFASDYNADAAVEAAQTNHLHITASDPVQQIGTEDSQVIVLAAHTHDTVQEVPIWARSIAVDKRSYLCLPNIINEPDAVFVEGGSRLAYGSTDDNYLWHITRLGGEGRLDKIGRTDVTFNVDDQDDVHNAIGVCEGTLKIAGSTPTMFKGDLWFEPYRFAENSFHEEANWLTLENNAGDYGWVFDGTEKGGLVITVATNAVLGGDYCFGTMGNIDVNIASNSTFVMAAPIVEYEGSQTIVNVRGGTSQFRDRMGPAGILRHESAVSIDFAADTRVELHTRHLHTQKVSFGGTLAVLPNQMPDDIGTLPLPGYVDENDRYTFFARNVRFWEVSVPGCTNEADNADAPVDFPLPVWLGGINATDDALAELQNNRDKIAAYIVNDDGTLAELAYEYDSYVEGKGALVWLSVPKLHKDFKAYFLMSAYKHTRTKPATDVWKDYTAVWHFNVDEDGRLAESTANGWETGYCYRNDAFELNEENYAKWHTNDVNMLGYGFTFNDGTSLSAAKHNGFIVTNALAAALAGSKGLSAEGFFVVGNTVNNYQKLLCYRPLKAGYSLAWLGGKDAGILKGTQFSYARDEGFGQLYNSETAQLNTDLKTYKKGDWFFAGVSMDANAWQTASMGGLKDYLTVTKQSYSNSESGSAITDGKLRDELCVAPESKKDFNNYVGMGFRTDEEAPSHNFCGVMDEMRIRRGPAPSELWTQTVAASATNGYVNVVACEIPDTYNGVCATESITFARGSTIKIDPDCVNGTALVLDLTYSGAKLITSSADASVTLDLTDFGKLKEEHDGTTLVKVLGSETPVNIFTYALKLSSKMTDEEKAKWALKTRSYIDAVYDEASEEYYSHKVTLIQLVKAQGAVLVVSPAASGDEWPASLPAPTREFAPDGHDYAVIPYNYNASTNLHDGAVIRDKFTGHTDGVTSELVNGSMIGVATPNTDYWFWFEGDNGAWSEDGNYTLNLTNETTAGGATIDEDATVYVQFAVSNQIFYGQSLGTLNSGELGFYVTYDDETGTNLVARILNTANDVKIPLNGNEDPWLVVTVAVKPYEGYEISFGDATRTLPSSFAEHPRQIRVTGVAPVDNIFVSTGNPNRDKLVYVHDMTRIGGDENNGWKWADRALTLSEEYFERVTRKIAEAGYLYRKPTSDNPEVSVLPVSFRSRVRRRGQVQDSDVPGSSASTATGDEHISLIDMLHLSTVVELEPADSGDTPAARLYPATSKDYGELEVYKLNYEYALGIHSVTRHENNAVTIYSVLSDSADSYDEEHLLGTGDVEHKLNGYLYIESTESPTPYKTNTVWKPVSISARPQFGDNHFNETFVAAPEINSNQTFRVRVNKTRPRVDGAASAEAEDPLQ